MLKREKSNSKMCKKCTSTRVETKRLVSTSLTFLITSHHLLSLLLFDPEILQVFSMVRRVNASQGNLLGSLSVDIGASTALVSLSSDNLVVVLTKVQSISAPGIEMVLHVDRSSSTLALTDRPVLLEGAGSIDRWLVNTGGDVDVVASAISRKATLVLSAAAWVVCSKVLDDIVLDKWVAGPAINGEVAISLWAERTTVVDGPTVSWVPTLSSTISVSGCAELQSSGDCIPNEITSVAPGHRVSATLTV